MIKAFKKYLIAERNFILEGDAYDDDWHPDYQRINSKLSAIDAALDEIEKIEAVLYKKATKKKLKKR